MEPSRQDLEVFIADPAAGLGHPDPVIRRMAASNLPPGEALAHRAQLVDLLTDDEQTVRAAAAEALGNVGSAALDDLIRAGSDEAPSVREAAATAMGEIGDPEVLPWLVEAAGADPDRSVREAATAALGAVGDRGAIEPLLALIAEAPPTVRRRAIAAITVFEDPRIEPAIRRAALDRNPGVRETAEMVVGRQIREA